MPLFVCQGTWPYIPDIQLSLVCCVLQWTSGEAVFIFVLLCCYYYSWCTVILYLLYINAWWFLPVNCCQKREKTGSDSHEQNNFLILCYAYVLHGWNSDLLEKCFSSDHDGSSNCSRKCFFVVLLLYIWTTVSFCLYVHMYKLTCLRVETWSLRPNENPGFTQCFFLYNSPWHICFLKKKSIGKSIFIVRTIPHLQIDGMQPLLYSLSPSSAWSLHSKIICRLICSCSLVALCTQFLPYVVPSVINYWDAGSYLKYLCLSYILTTVATLLIIVLLDVC